jgi:hypothetical protein
VSINASVGTGGIAWSSALTGVDRVGLGPGRGITGGGVCGSGWWGAVFSGSGGVFEADASTPSGTRTYVRDDFRFHVVPGCRRRVPTAPSVNSRTAFLL